MKQAIAYNKLKNLTLKQGVIRLESENSGFPTVLKGQPVAYVQIDNTALTTKLAYSLSDGQKVIGSNKGWSNRYYVDLIDEMKHNLPILG